MKILLLIATLLTGCTQKYNTYSTIKKDEFKIKQEDHNPIIKKMYGIKKVKEHVCIGQWFFNSNAQDLAEKSIPTLLSHTCKGENYLLDVTLTHRWWTTIIYSRACYIIEATCPQVRE